MDYIAVALDSVKVLLQRYNLKTENAIILYKSKTFQLTNLNRMLLLVSYVNALLNVNVILK